MNLLSLDPLLLDLDLFLLDLDLLSFDSVLFDQLLSYLMSLNSKLHTNMAHFVDWLMHLNLHFHMFCFAGVK